MIEFAMVFALGALAATLLALSALPALDRRAQRLARRRLEALFPMSISEIAAERDHVRAAMAVEARRAEVKAEATARGKAADMADIGRRDRAIHELTKAMVERDAAIAALQTTLAAANDHGARTAALLGETESRLAELDHVLSSLRTAHQDVTVKYDADHRSLAANRQSLAAADEKLSTIERRLNETIEANATLQLELRAAVGLATERQLAIATLDAQLETALGDAREATRQLAAARDLNAQREAAIIAADRRSTDMAAAESAANEKIALVKAAAAASNAVAESAPIAPRPHKPRPPQRERTPTATRARRSRRDATKLPEAAE